MKILWAEKFQPKKRSQKEGLNSATPETKEEDIRIDEGLENQPTDGYAEQNAFPDLKPRTKDEILAKVDPEPEGLSDQLSRAYADPQHDPDLEVFPEPQPGEPSEKSPQNETKTKNLTDYGEQTFFESLPDDNPDPEHRSNGEPLSKDMNLSNNPSDHKPKENLEHTSPEEQQTKFTPQPGQGQKLEENQKSMGTGEAPLKDTASGRALRRFALKAVSKPEDEDKERPKPKKKDSGGTGGEITGPPRFSLRDVLHILFKRKLQILICFFFVVLTAIIVTLLMKPVYEASAQILIKLGRESVFVPTSSKMSPILNINREQQLNSEIEILKSRSLAENVVAALGPTVIYKSLAKEKPGILNLISADRRSEMTPDERKAANFESAVEGFSKALGVTGVRKSNVVLVKFRHEDAHMAAKVVNNLSHMYLDRHLAVHKTPQNVKFFQEQTSLLKNKLEQAEEKLKTLRKQHNITSLEEQRSLLLGQLAQLSSSLNETISQEVETEKRLGQLRRQLASVPEMISLGVESDQNPYLFNSLEVRLVELQLKEQELLTKYTDNNRLVVNVKEEIRVVEQKMEEQSTRRYGSKTSSINPTHRRLKEELFRNEAEVEALKAKKITQKTHLGGFQDRLERLNRVELELKQLVQGIEVDRENHRLYLAKLEQARISDAMDSEKISGVSLMGPARPPRKPVSPKLKLNILVAIFLGLFGGLSLALFREYLDDRIEKIEDVEGELRLPVLASIPVFEKKAAGA